ncbi:increased DNA methylation 1-like [Hibiscus syriacus]|uniref:increased DNA methylation 1-like n=1 Tax=Hibiscus syriacus TaxID=106335 RepID=UPI001925120D|nr:increased DNA methylation 1-like [Hibiscus syriacus]
MTPLVHPTIEAFPSGNWNCVYCTCKFCGMVGNTHQRGKDDGVVPTVLTCHLCEEKYHEPCILPMDAFDDDSSSAFFCGKICKDA